MDPDLVIARKALTQHSLVTRRQLLALGLSERQIERRVALGLLIPLHPGVYALAGTDRDYEQDVMAACLASGGVASHRCAGALFSLRGLRRRLVEITVDGRAPKLKGVIAHRSRSLPRTFIGRIPVTPPARTLIDVAAVAPHLAAGAVADVLVRRISSLSALVWGIEESGRRGREGTALLRREVNGYLAGKRPTESVLEDEFLKLLRRHGIPEPVRQFPPPWDPRRRVDFARPEDRLLIELDGRLWHSSAADRARDLEKDERAAAHAWRTVRITWVDVHDTPTRVVDELSGRRAA